MEPCIRQDAEADLAGGTAIVTFPGTGFASTLAAAYLAEELRLKPIGAMDCEAVPAVAIVEQGQVVEPVRILAKRGKTGASRATRLVVFLSEVPLQEESLRPVAGAILAWCAANKIRVLISLENATVEGEPEEVESVRLWGVSDHADSNARLAKAGLPMAQEGVVGGLTGCLLNQGLQAPFEVIGLVATCRAREPDVVGAAALVEFLTKFLQSQRTSCRTGRGWVANLRPTSCFAPGRPFLPLTGPPCQATSRRWRCRLSQG